MQSRYFLIVTCFTISARQSQNRDGHKENAYKLLFKACQRKEQCLFLRHSMLRMKSNYRDQEGEQTLVVYNERGHITKANSGTAVLQGLSMAGMLGKRSCKSGYHSGPKCKFKRNPGAGTEMEIILASC